MRLIYAFGVVLMAAHVFTAWRHGEHPGPYLVALFALACAFMERHDAVQDRRNGGSNG